MKIQFRVNTFKNLFYSFHGFLRNATTEKRQAWWKKEKQWNTFNVLKKTKVQIKSITYIIW